MINRKERIHFIGIGGAGMFPMAEVLHRRGYPVTGSDAQASDATEQLRAWGLSVQVGHEPDLVKDADIVVYSSAVPHNNPELVAARKSGAVIMKRAVMLGDLMRSGFSIGVAGTHGKTTTTSMIAIVLQAAEKTPTVIVGGIFRGSDLVSGAMVGDGSLLVCEADEYDRSFLKMSPSVAVITNIEEDHLDIYEDIVDIRGAFTEYAEKVPFYGQVIGCIDDPEVAALLPTIAKPVVTYGTQNGADFQITDIYVQEGTSFGTIIARGKTLGEMALPLLGVHNQLNALAAVAVAYDMGVSVSTIFEALAAFPGVKRRMELMGKVDGITVMDDYAHHPTEVIATLNAIAQAGFSRVTVLFQPHLYSRTQEFVQEFADALSSSSVDRSFVLPIYKAREKPVAGVSAQLIVDKGAKKLKAVTDRASLIQELVATKQDGEVILLMGAGDVWQWGKPLLEALV